MFNLTRVLLIVVLNGVFFLWVFGMFFLLDCTIHTTSPQDFEQLRDELRRQQEINRKQSDEIEIYHRLEQLEISLMEERGTLNPSGVQQQKVSETTVPFTLTERPTGVERFALLLITYIRAESLNRSLSGVFKYLNNAPVDVIISQDGDNLQVANLVKKYQQSHKLSHIQHRDRTPLPKLKEGELQGYYFIAQHYKFALTYTFNQNYDYVIILEEDLDIAPDFFSYFIKMHELLVQDDSLYCISAWNDNGRPGLVKDHEKLYRTDFFPGLGWMLSKKLWLEIGGRWPAGYWDDWLREPNQRKGRSCIYPEISRTYTFGLSDGTSLGQFSQQYLKDIMLNNQLVDWPSKNLSYLLKPIYDKEFSKKIKNLPSSTKELVESMPDQEILVEFSAGAHEVACKHFGLMTDEKAGVLRTSYQGVISFWRGTKKIYLAPAGIKEKIGTTVT